MCFAGLHPARHFLVRLLHAPHKSFGVEQRAYQPAPLQPRPQVRQHRAELGAQLRRQIATSGTTTVTEDAEQAEARLQILGNNRGREILSLTGAGKVREYQLTQSLRFQLLDKAGKPLIPPTSLSARREYTFDDSQVLGKEQEENLLYRDMQADLVQQMMRRLAAARRAG